MPCGTLLSEKITVTGEFKHFSKSLECHAAHSWARSSQWHVNRIDIFLPNIVEHLPNTGGCLNAPKIVVVFCTFTWTLRRQYLIYLVICIYIYLVVTTLLNMLLHCWTFVYWKPHHLPHLYLEVYDVIYLIQSQVVKKNK